MNEPDDSHGFCTSDLKWCAVPYTNGRYIIIHEGGQVRLCRSLKTAKTFIQEKQK